MNTFLVLVLCSALALGVIGAPKSLTSRIRLRRDSPASGDPSNKQRYEEGIKNLLSPLCNQDHTCDVLVNFVASFCGVPSRSTICQSDCKFLLHHLYDKTLVNNRPDIVELLKFVPDNCSPILINPSKQESDTYTDRRVCPQEEAFALTDNSNHGTEDNKGFSSPSNSDFREDLYEGDDDFDDLFAEMEAFVAKSDNVTCLIPHPLEGQPSQLHPGDITSKPCKEEYPFQRGDIMGVCLETGHIQYSNEHCETNAEDLEKGLEEYAASMEKMAAIGKIDPKAALKGGADVLKGVANFLKKDKVKEFLPIAGKIASFLGPVGVAFQVIAFFLPEQDPKHDAIMAEFKKLEQQTAELKNAINRLPNIFKKELFDARIEQMVSNLIFLEGEIEIFATQNSEAFRNRVKSSCANFPGDKFINDVTQIFESKSPAYIAELYGYDHNQFASSLAKPILVYAIRASAAATKCLGLDKAATERDTQRFAQTMQKRVEAMFKKINYIDEDWIPNNAMNQWIDNDLTEWIEKHKGEDNGKLASNLYPYLSKKYDFYKFAVAVFNKDSSPKKMDYKYKCFRCSGKENSGMYFSDKQYDKAVMVMYSNKFIPEMEKKIQDVYLYANRKTLTFYVEYLIKGNIRNALAVRHGQGLRASYNNGGAARFYNFQGTSTLVTF